MKARVRSLNQKIIDKTGVDTFLESYCQIRTKRVNESFVFICPFHAEKRASFAVYKDRGFGKCFSCGEIADLVKIYAAKNNLQMKDACKKLVRDLELTGVNNG